MAFSEHYCDPVNGSNLNSGSTNAAPVYTGVGDSDGTSVFTPSDGSTPASTVSVGMEASIYVTIGATVAVYISRITNVAAGVNGAITTSTTAKAGTIPTASAGAHTITCKVGGYWLGPNNAVGFPFGFITATLTDSGGDYPRVNFLNTATYNITAAITHSLAGPIYFQGASATPGDGGRFILDGGTSGTGYTALTLSGAQLVLRDMIGRNNGASGSTNWLLMSGSKWQLERVTVTASRLNGIACTNPGEMVEVEVYSCNQANNAAAGGFSLSATGAMLKHCLSHDNNGKGFILGAAVTLQDCVADTNTGDGFSTNAAGPFQLEECTSYNNGGGGFDATSGNNNSTMYLENCLFANNTGAGVINAGTSNIIRLSNVAYYSNTGGNTSGVVDETGAITCSAQPMTDPANGDFSLNSTAGGGASCRNAGRGKFVQNAGSYSKTTTAFPDVGAVQHQDAGGGVSGPLIYGG